MHQAVDSRRTRMMHLANSRVYFFLFDYLELWLGSWDKLTRKNVEKGIFRKDGSPQTLNKREGTPQDIPETF